MFVFLFTRPSIAANLLITHQNQKLSIKTAIKGNLSNLNKAIATYIESLMNKGCLLFSVNCKL